MSEIIGPTELEMKDLIPYLRDAIGTFKRTSSGSYEGKRFNFSLPAGEYNNMLLLNEELVAHSWPREVSGWITPWSRMGPHFTLYQERNLSDKTNDSRTEWMGNFDLDETRLLVGDEFWANIPLANGIYIQLSKRR